MSHRTLFAGLSAPDLGESPFTVDNGDFIYRNPDLMDQFLRIGAVTHHHDGHAALPNPSHAITASVVASAGAIPASGDFYLTFTLTDQYGGETLAAPATHVQTGGQAPAPTQPPTATVSHASGIMPAGNYAYAQTYTDGGGGETTIGPVVWVNVPPGYASSEVVLNFPALPAGASQCRLWRSYEGEDWHLAAQFSATTFTDTGFDPPDNPARPPATNTTGQTSTILATIPTSAIETAMASAVTIRVYLSPDDTFTSPALLAALPIASAGATLVISSDATSDGQPPAVSTSIPGANQINPDTDLLDWHWKRPVPTPAYLPATGNASGDARISMSPLAIFTWSSTANQWQVVAAASGVNAPTNPQTLAASAGASAIPAFGELVFTGSGAATVSVQQVGAANGGSALVTITVPPVAAGTTSAGWVASAGSASAAIGSFLGFAGSGGVQAQLVNSNGSATILINASALAGSRWYAFTPAGSSDVVPHMSANDGDFALRETDGEVFEHQGGIWTDLGFTLMPVTPGSPSLQGIGVAGSGHVGMLVPETYVEFAGSGGTSVGIQDLGGGSARVVISTASAISGIAVAGSGGANLLVPETYVEFAGSGGTSVAVQGLGGGSARVVISASAGATSISSSANVPSGYVFRPADAGTVIESASASAAVGYIIPRFADGGIPVGSVLEVFQYGIGQINVVGASANVLLRSDGGRTHTAGQFATIGLRQRAQDEWVLSGDLV